ncbi:MAG: hypothetical protein WC155_01975 [Candidatus Cloacimonadales bacterium]
MNNFAENMLLYNSIYVSHRDNLLTFFYFYQSSLNLYSTLLYSTLLYSTLLYSTLLYSTLLYSTLLYSTLLYSTIY